MTSHNTENLPVPVILAANPLRALWPCSTPDLPYSFAPDASGISPVRNLVETFLNHPGFVAPLLVVSDKALTAAVAELRYFKERGVRAIVVPSDSRNGAAAVLAAIEAGSPGHDPALLYVPATLKTTDLAGFARMGAEACEIARQRNRAVMFAARALDAQPGLHLKSGARDQFSGFLKVEKAWKQTDTDQAAAAREFGELFRLSGPVAAPASLVIAQSSKILPTLVSACTNALTLADRAGCAIHPNAGFLSLAGAESIAGILVAEPETLLICQASVDMRVVQSWNDLEPAEIAARRPDAAIAGVDARIVQGHGGVFVFTEKAARLAEDHFNRAANRADGAAGRGIHADRSRAAAPSYATTIR